MLQLSINQTPYGPAPAVHLIDSLVTDKQVKFDWNLPQFSVFRGVWLTEAPDLR